MKRFYSGSGSLANPQASLGGAINSNEIANSTANAVWDDTSPAESEAGDTEFRCFYAKWTGPETIRNIVLYFASKAKGPDDTVFIGKGTSGKNGTEQTIANENAIPVGVTFTNPGARSAGILLADSFATNDRQAVWLKKTVNAGADVLENEDYELKIEFDPPGGGGPAPVPSPDPNDPGKYNHGFGGDCDCGGDFVKNVNNMKNKSIQRFFPTGDYSYDDNSATCWTNDVSPIKNQLKTIVMGNHEVEEGAASHLKNDYLNFVGQSKQWAVHTYRNQVYFIFSQYTSYGSGSEQYDFMKAQLEKYRNDANYDWRFCMFHEPMYTISSHHGIDHPSFRDTWHPLFDTNNIDFVLHGHNHNYQRSFPISYGGGSTPVKESSLTTGYSAPFAGQIHICMGTLGKGTYDLSGSRSYYVTDDNSKYVQHGYGILEFSNNDQTLIIKFYNTSNSLIDSCTINHS